MANATVDKYSCVRCWRARGLIHCNGCGALFCYSCFSHHRNEISAQFDRIREQRDHLRYIYGHHEAPQEHPLCSKINVWEHDTITNFSNSR